VRDAEDAEGAERRTTQRTTQRAQRGGARREGPCGGRRGCRGREGAELLWDAFQVSAMKKPGGVCRADKFYVKFVLELHVAFENNREGFCSCVIFPHQR